MLSRNVIVMNKKKAAGPEVCDLIEKARLRLCAREGDNVSGLEMLRRLGVKKPHGEKWDRIKKGSKIGPRAVVRLAELLGAEEFVQLLRQFGRVGK
jgi:hypothetical protein